MKSFVYMLKHSNADLFKIGKANNVGNRISSIGAHHFDLASSLAFELPSPEKSFDLENVLHRALSKFRALPHVVTEKCGRMSSGETEWFGAECFQDAAGLVEKIGSLFGATPAKITQKKEGKPAAKITPPADQIDDEMTAGVLKKIADEGRIIFFSGEKLYFLAASEGEALDLQKASDFSIYNVRGLLIHCGHLFGGRDIDSEDMLCQMDVNSRAADLFPVAISVLSRFKDGSLKAAGRLQDEIECNRLPV